MDFVFTILVLMCQSFLLLEAAPQFCTRGFQLASRFHKCWEQETFANKYPPLYERREFLDAQLFGAYATHMCSVVKPKALRCLERNVKECDNHQKIMEIADASGGACSGSGLNPLFKTHVIDKLVAVKSDSPCFELGDNSYECYSSAGQKVMRMGREADDIITFHKVADKFFNAYWECMVEIYKSNIAICPNWQIPMLLTLQRTAMPSLFGLRLQPAQIQKLELSNSSGVSPALVPGPAKLFLLLQLHKTRPQIASDDDTVVVELDNLNSQNPKIELEAGVRGEEVDVNRLPLWELKKLMRENRRRTKELRDFIVQAKGLADKRNKGSSSSSSSKSSSSGSSSKSSKKGAKKDDTKKTTSRKKLNQNDMIA